MPLLDTYNSNDNNNFFSIILYFLFKLSTIMPISFASELIQYFFYFIQGLILLYLHPPEAWPPFFPLYTAAIVVRSLSYSKPASDKLAF